MLLDYKHKAVTMINLPAIKAKPFTTPPAYLVTSPTTKPPNAYIIITIRYCSLTFS